MAPANTRRWQRHQVKLPVRIITVNGVSKIAVPGLTTEISRGGMALYGGVPMQPGDLMEVEFQTSNRLRVAGSVRDRDGYCFGLEFLGLMPDEDAELAALDFAAVVREQTGLGKLEPLAIEAAGVHPMENGSPSSIDVEVAHGASEIFELFLERHEAYLHQRESEIQRMRQEISEIRKSRREIEAMAQQFLGRSE
jgi:PilZ domain-containing protein